jgi:uncharacterized membrane-anchored protein YhcB (DUF1043 family)
MENYKDYIYFLVLVCIMMFLLQHITPSKQETFVDIDKEIKSLTNTSNKMLKNFREDATLFSQFCKKIQNFDDNYSPNSKILQLDKDLKQNILDKQKKKQEYLLKEIFDMQEKIYYDKTEIDNIVNYNKKIDAKTKQYTDILDKAIVNLKQNLNSEIILNVK